MAITLYILPCSPSNYSTSVSLQHGDIRNLAHFALFPLPGTVPSEGGLGHAEIAVCFTFFPVENKLWSICRTTSTFCLIVFIAICFSPAAFKTCNGP